MSEEEIIIINGPKKPPQRQSKVPVKPQPKPIPKKPK